jgi:hypothetical protein
MNKVLLFIFLLSGASLTGIAQTKPLSQLSIGVEMGDPVGSIATVYGTAIGASVKFEAPLSNPRFLFTITAGITDYIVKLDYVAPANAGVKTYIPPLTYIPIEIGGKYYFSKISYVEGDVGLSTNINKQIINSKQALIFSPIIGFTAPVYKRKSKIDIGLRYEGRVETGGPISQVAIRVAYRFGL